MPQLHAYLSFDGNCTEAMQFYARVFDAKLEALMTYGEVPGGPPMPPDAAKRIMHAYLTHADFQLMAGDTPPGIPYQGINGVMISVTCQTAAEAKRIFAALAAGGTITMPEAESFWADSFAMCTDRFGTPWGISGGPRPVV